MRDRRCCCLSRGQLRKANVAPDGLTGCSSIASDATHPRPCRHCPAHLTSPCTGPSRHRSQQAPTPNNIGHDDDGIELEDALDRIPNGAHDNAHPSAQHQPQTEATPRLLCRPLHSRHTLPSPRYVVSHRVYLFLSNLSLAVAARFGIGGDFWLNLLLTICGYFPGESNLNAFVFACVLKYLQDTDTTSIFKIYVITRIELGHPNGLPDMALSIPP
jgi:uncharacterized membrane protein YqaE (UPF0057 family)